MSLNLGTLLGWLIKLIDIAEAAGVTVPASLSTAYAKVSLHAYGDKDTIEPNEDLKAEVVKLLEQAKTSEPILEKDITNVLGKIAGNEEKIATQPAETPVAKATDFAATPVAPATPPPAPDPFA